MTDISVRACPRGASQYTWQAGDTLAGVALRFGTTEQAIRLTNEYTDFAQLLPGDILCIPPGALTCVSGARYAVQPGDTFQSIAERFGISTLELAERNPYVQPDALRAGQILCVPESERACPAGYTPGVVRQGQTYAALLVENDVSDAAFRAANPTLNVDSLRAGDAYCMPPMGSRGLCESGSSYIIKNGETLHSLARRLGVTVGALLRLNPYLAPGDFLPGRVICIG